MKDEMYAKQSTSISLFIIEASTFIKMGILKAGIKNSATIPQIERTKNV
jgi:hypothetical protein